MAVEELARGSLSAKDAPRPRMKTPGPALEHPRASFDDYNKSNAGNEPLQIGSVKAAQWCQQLDWRGANEPIPDSIKGKELMLIGSHFGMELIWSNHATLDVPEKGRTGAHGRRAKRNLSQETAARWPPQIRTSSRISGTSGDLLVTTGSKGVIFNLRCVFEERRITGGIAELNAIFGDLCHNYRLAVQSCTKKHKATTSSHVEFGSNQSLS
ncbi:hypothetical protein C8J56DRAFT_892051 [Mycena floridula]|nr:hypothetical protein C8J56DRAFT_892051 [Mycena floridula]